MNTANNNTQTAFYLISAEQLQEVAQAAADKVAAQYEAKRNDRMCTPIEAAEILHVTKPTLWRWERSGILKPERIGGRVLYRYSDIVKVQGL